MWALVVGRPGVLKSPAMEAALAPLKRLIAKANEEYKAAFEDYKLNLTVAKVRAEVAEKSARKQLEKDPSVDLSAVLAVDEVDEPILKRYTANDTSPASLGKLLRQNQNGLLVYRDELVSLLKGLDREDQAEGRGFYLTGWAGDSPCTFDRIGRGLNLHIEAVCLSVLGGTQPGRLAEYIGQAVRGGTGDDGLIQRFGLLVWPDTSGTWRDVDRWPDNEAKNTAFRVYEYLDNIDPASIGAEQDVDLDGKPDGTPYLRLSEGALEIFQEWRAALEPKVRGGDLHPALESHFAKYRKLIPWLALIIHLADSGTGPVSEEAMLKAVAWGDYLETHAFRAYGAISHPEVAAAKAGPLPGSGRATCRPLSRAGTSGGPDGPCFPPESRWLALCTFLLIMGGYARNVLRPADGQRPSTTLTRGKEMKWLTMLKSKKRLPEKLPKPPKAHFDSFGSSEERHFPENAPSKPLPYLDEGGDIVIPFDSDPKYHWWLGSHCAFTNAMGSGQSIEETINEITDGKERS